jgi:hypothetical protein
MDDRIIECISNRIKVPNLIELLSEKLSFSDLQSLLMRLFDVKVRTKNQIDLLKEYDTNRFVKPSDIDPVSHRKLELGIFSLLPEEFIAIELSPLAPLGTSSVLTTVHQNNVISTIRNTEVAADTTNILALECAIRRKKLLKNDKNSVDRIRLCSSQTVTRGQPFENKAFSSSFNVVALCTAGKDEGNDKFEVEALTEHISYYLRIFDRLLDPGDIKNIRIKFFEYDDSSNINLVEKIKSLIDFRKEIIIESELNSKYGKGYYTRLRFMINIVNQSNKDFNYVDGGFTDWTSKLLNNKKERLLTSGIGTYLLLRTVRLQSQQ